MTVSVYQRVFTGRRPSLAGRTSRNLLLEGRYADGDLQVSGLCFPGQRHGVVGICGSDKWLPWAGEMAPRAMPCCGSRRTQTWIPRTTAKYATIVCICIPAPLQQERMQRQTLEASRLASLLCTVVNKRSCLKQGQRGGLTPKIIL